MPNFAKIVKAEDVITPTAADVYAVLTGDFVAKQGLGADWNTANAGTIMKRTAKGVYELTVNFTTPGKYNYKVAFNNQWDKPKAIGENGENKPITVANAGAVTFRVDYTAGKVYDTINNIDQFRIAPTTATLVGGFANSYWKRWRPYILET
ncbi:hypothetical protein HMPREF1982_01627 [Clostridiales bacterium oral taxon 876 str. F0540]|nr:hypothetical protein HMPREF1982_01627 [Clostridiales bacterium oral taxon 876 str. F0540]